MLCTLPLSSIALISRNSSDIVLCVAVSSLNTPFTASACKSISWSRILCISSCRSGAETSASFSPITEYSSFLNACNSSANAAFSACASLSRAAATVSFAAEKSVLSAATSSFTLMISSSTTFSSLETAVSRAAPSSASVVRREIISLISESAALISSISFACSASVSSRTSAISLCNPVSSSKITEIFSSATAMEGCGSPPSPCDATIFATSSLYD